MGGTEIAFVDRRGFFPGDVFGVLPLPARLLLPTEDVAYLEIRDPDTGTPLVQSSAVANGFSVSTTADAPVSLVLPGIPNATGGPTVLPVHFDVVVNGASHALVSGTIDVSAPVGGSLFDLDALGLPCR
jgi:large repetitive protein